MVDEAKDNSDDIDVEEGEDTEEGAKKKRLSGRTIVLFILLPLLGVSGIGFGAMKFLGSSEELTEEELHAEATPARKDPNDLLFHELEEILVNIRTADNRSKFLSLKVSLELDKTENIETLQVAMPRVRDQFQVYLRELRLEDLTGAAGTQRVKEELLRRVNIAADPVKVDAVLIREMVVQ